MSAVLVVDDDRDTVEIVSRELQGSAHEVHVSSGFAEAIETLRRTPIDVLVTELTLHDGDGMTLMQVARRMRPTLRPILLSASATARDHQTAIELGAVRVLSKPLAMDELHSAIAQADDCQTGFRGNVHGLSLVDMLQMFHFARRSVGIKVADAKPGAIFLRDGEIVHAEHGELRGERALQTLLSKSSGSLRTTTLPPSNTSIDKDFQSLLLDTVRAIDERARGLQPREPSTSSSANHTAPDLRQTSRYELTFTSMPPASSDPEDSPTQEESATPTPPLPPPPRVPTPAPSQRAASTPATAVRSSAMPDEETDGDELARAFEQAHLFDRAAVIDRDGFIVWTHGNEASALADLAFLATALESLAYQHLELGNCEGAQLESATETVLVAHGGDLCCAFVSGRRVPPQRAIADVARVLERTSRGAA